MITAPQATSGGVPGPAPHRMLDGHHVFRVVSQLNTDLLVGHCWCGAARSADDPIELWTWLLAHPDTHGESG